MPTIAVIGYSDATRDHLERAAAPSDAIRFAPALRREEAIVRPEGYPFEERLDLAARRAREVGPEGVLTYWDFPSSLIAPLVARRLGLRYASLESVMKCEHKLWFRREQSAVVDAPRFSDFDPFGDDPLSQIGLDFPFWVKPVVGHSSMLGFEIGSRAAFDTALEAIRGGVGGLTEPFRYPLSQTRLPEDLARKGPTLCIAEELISSGEQYTVEGFASEGEVVIYGVVASVRAPNGHSFARYQYPAALDGETARRMEETARAIVRRLDYRGCPFNIEFFHEPESGRIHVLEMNSRLSQSHSDLFHKVDGRPHQAVAVDLALGRAPRWERGGGRFAVAAKFFLRHYEDGRVAAVPGEEALARLLEETPDARVELNVSEGQRLSDLPQQDAYSFELADIFLGARDEAELLRKFERCRALLRFEITPD